MLWFNNRGGGPSPLIPLLTIVVLCFFINGLGVFEAFSGAGERGGGEDEEVGGGSNKLLLMLIPLVLVLLMIHYCSESLPSFSWSFGGGQEGNSSCDDEGYGLGTILFLVLFLVLYHFM
ncbi:unnamed protein product [Musa acuminata var. zebrina]